MKKCLTLLDSFCLRLISSILVFLCSGACGYVLDDLMSDVFTGYEPAVRPLCGVDQPVRVGMDIALRQIIELDEPHQFLDTLIWLRISWKDCRLTWNSSYYDNIDTIVIPERRVWIPDLTLYDNSAETKLEGMKQYSVSVDNKGGMDMRIPSVIRSLCAVDVTNFPFDLQSCKLTFGSWSYNGRAVDVSNTSKTADLSSYVGNVEWNVIGVPVIRLETAYGVDIYPTVTFLIQLQRRPLFYALNLFLPCLVISSVAVLGFLLPPAAGEKVSLELTVLLSLAFFQLIILEMIPPSGEKVPFIALYYTISMSLVGCSCLMTVIVLKAHFMGRKQKVLPGFLRQCMLVPLARVFRVKLSYQMTENTASAWPYMSPGRDRRESRHRPSINTISVTQDTYTDISEKICNVHSTNTSPDDIQVQGHQPPYRKPEEAEVRLLINRMVTQLEQLCFSLDTGVQESDITNEWETLAMVLDRIFLLLYLVTWVTSIVTLSVKFTTDTEMPELWHNT